MSATINPSFEPPPDDSDQEIWLLRAPAHLDVSELLNGVTLSFDPQASSSTSNNILSTFQSGDQEYSLALGDANESESLRLLVPDGESSNSSSEHGNPLSLIPHDRPFLRHVRLASRANNANESSGDHHRSEDLLVAPPEEDAPAPATGGSGNGSVDSVRRAYVPVPQRRGLKRRWAMPGSGIREASPSAIFSPTKKEARAVVAAVEVTPRKGGDAVVSDDEPRTNVVKSSSKKEKKEKKKKEKKSEKKSKKSSKK